MKHWFSHEQDLPLGIDVLALGHPVDLGHFERVTHVMQSRVAARGRPPLDRLATGSVPAELEAELAALRGSVPTLVARVLERGIRGAYRFLGTTDARVVVLFDEAVCETALMSIALRHLGKTSVSMAHATHIEESYQHSAFEVALIYGPSSRETGERPTALRYGRTVEVGAPSFDRFTAPIAPVRTPVRHILYLAINAVRGRERDYEQTANAIRTLAEARPELKLTIKEHPIAVNELNRTMADLPNVTIVQKGDLLELMDQHDLCISVDYCNTLLETVLRRRPHVWLNTSPHSDFYRAVEYGYSIEARDGDQLLHAIDAWDRRGGVVDEPAANRIIDWHLAHLGGAAEEAAKVLDELAARAGEL
ncbi:MAG: hypothetical protein ACPGOU_01220 [Candidatus Nanopelagicales bacterium]